MSQEAITSPPRPPRPPQQQRTMTLGPSAPIHDWEVEKVTVCIHVFDAETSPVICHGKKEGERARQ